MFFLIDVGYVKMRRSDSVSLFVVSALPEACPSQPLGRLSLALFVCSILLV